MISCLFGSWDYYYNITFMEMKCILAYVENYRAITTNRCYLMGKKLIKFSRKTYYNGHNSNNMLFSGMS